MLLLTPFICLLFQPSENVHVKVVGRVRPLTTEEGDKGGKSVVKVAGGDKLVVEAAGKV